MSQGVVFGLRLYDGRRIVIKAHNPRRSTDFLTAVVRVQRYLVEHDYPCPRPLLDPRPFAGSYAVVEELIDEGIYTDAHDPVIRRSLAEMLAWLLKLTCDPERIPGLRPSALDLHLPPDVLWPVPHNAIFDFEATTVGAEWIDDIAHKAKEMWANGVGDLVLGHTDWSIKHLRYIDGVVRVIYDWDSLALDKEPVIVGSTAMSFTYTEVLNVPRFPTREESLAFVAEYEDARGRPFTVNEKRTLAAASTYGLCYCARCEHSLAPEVRAYHAGSCRELLAQYKDTFLTFDA
ncbi:MAG: hypothetical protein NVSMB33_05200 [Ktedonobacteraceae bacterium]